MYDLYRQPIKLTELQLKVVADCIRQSLAWGKTYGSVINMKQWDEMREKQVEQHLATIKRGPLMEIRCPICGSTDCTCHLGPEHHDI